MPKVQKSLERKFWKGLQKAFQGLVDQVKQSGGFLHGVTPEVRKFLQSEPFTEYLNRLVGKMAYTLRHESAATWRQAAMKGSHGRQLYDLVTEEMKGPVGMRVSQIISDNVAYIKTLPENWARYAVEYAAREALKGRRPEDIEKELRRIIPEHVSKNLKCIARTECAKANAAIVQARAEMCGIRCYIWRSVNDEQSRDAHKKMDGILIFYDDPPNPEALFPSKGQRPYGKYHAGNTFNCRCYQESVVDIDFLPDSIRVHDHGSIRTMTRAQILKKYGQIA